MNGIPPVQKEMMNGIPPVQKEMMNGIPPQISPNMGNMANFYNMGMGFPNFNGGMFPNNNGSSLN